MINFVLVTPNRIRKDPRILTSQTSSVTEVASDEVDLDIEPERVTQYV